MTIWRFAVGPGASSPDSRPLRELATAHGRVVTWRLNGHPVAQVSLDGRSGEAAEIVPLVSDLWVWRDGILMFRGRVTTAVHDVDTTRHGVQVTAIGYRGMLAYRTVGASEVVYTGVAQAAIAWDLIADSQARTGGDWGITQGLAPSGTPRDRTYPAGKDLLSAITELGEVDGGFEWEISPELELNVWTPRRGVDGGVVIDFGGVASAVSSTVAPDRFGTAVIVTGSEDTVPVADELDDLDGDPRGRWELVESSPTVTLQSTLDERAPETLASASRLAAPWQIRMAPGRWGGPGHLWLGDIAGLRVGSGALATSRVRIVEISITAGESGTDEVRLGAVEEPEEV